VVFLNSESSVTCCCVGLEILSRITRIAVASTIPRSLASCLLGFQQITLLFVIASYQIFGGQFVVKAKRAMDDVALPRGGLAKYASDSIIILICYLVVNMTGPFPCLCSNHREDCERFSAKGRASGSVNARPPAAVLRGYAFALCA
jgi:hypothetical protein